MFPSELLPCLMVALPLVGAGLVLLSPPKSPDQARWTALTNVLLTFVLALLLALRTEWLSYSLRSVRSRWRPPSAAPATRAAAVACRTCCATR